MITEADITEEATPSGVRWSAKGKTIFIPDINGRTIHTDKAQRKRKLQVLNAKIRSAND